ncbi:MAG: hypothetical protein MRY59_06105 [Aquisalinus sp.]|nr:hypothetical protein [Aquisalinus sp.]
MLIVRFLISLLAIAMIVVGTVLMVSPVPLGILIILLGVLILVMANPHARPMLKWIRHRWPWFSERVRDLEEHAPSGVAGPLRETDPNT